MATYPYLETDPSDAPSGGARAPIGLEDQLRRGIRPVFPNSVVAGGAYSTAELRAAAQSDSVVATHYKGLRLDRFQPVRLAHARMAHVSFRVGSQIYWTKNRVTIRPGEVVLTDGDNKIRARCGNRISDLPQFPALPGEPAEKTMDEPTPDILVLPALANPVADPPAEHGVLSGRGRASNHADAGDRRRDCVVARGADSARPSPARLTQRRRPRPAGHATGDTANHTSNSAT